VVDKENDLRSQKDVSRTPSAITSLDNGRVIVSPPGDGALNMAIDDALLAEATNGFGPTLRFYRWQEPTLSLGYFQSIADRAQHSTSKHLAVVRRASGGGAIIHDRELTYSLVLPTPDKSIRGAAPDVYRAVHNAFIECLDDYGISAQRFGGTGRTFPFGEPFLCFQRRTSDDLVVSGYKVLGSAQRRGPAGLLQHGSLLLWASPMAPELPGIFNLASRNIELDSLIDGLTTKLAAACGVTWSAGELTSGEMSSASRSLGGKFSSLEWTFKR